MISINANAFLFHDGSFNYSRCTYSFSKLWIHDTELVLFLYPATAAVWEKKKVANAQHQCRIEKDSMLDPFNSDDAILKPDLIRTYFLKMYL